MARVCDSRSPEPISRPGADRGPGSHAEHPTQEQPALEALLQQAFYRERNIVERFLSKLKHFRRVATRYEKLAAKFLAMIQLASMRLWLRAYESTA